MSGFFVSRSQISHGQAEAQARARSGHEIMGRLNVINVIKFFSLFCSLIIFRIIPMFGLCGLGETTTMQVQA